MKAIARPFKKLRCTLSTHTESSATDSQVEIPSCAGSTEANEVIELSDDDPDPEKELSKYTSNLFYVVLIGMQRCSNEPGACPFTHSSNLTSLSNTMKADLAISSVVLHTSARLCLVGSGTIKIQRIRPPLPICKVVIL